MVPSAQATSAPSSTAFADKLTMQHRLFAELSAMFGREVPLYDKSLLVNRITNRAVCDLLKAGYSKFSITDEELDKVSGERHGAIRIGTPEEYRWVAGFFAAFAMEPHNFYDMTTLGAKSQPIVATAFRSTLNPEHRVFTSLLMIDYFDPETRQRVAGLLGRRQVFSDRAKELVLKNEQQGGLTPDEADELIREGTTRIFKWTGRANDFKLYKELSDAGFKIAADISCFESHHLNHLTPNTFCMDLYTAAMRLVLNEVSTEEFERLATRALQQLRSTLDDFYMKLHFRHLSLPAIQELGRQEVPVELPTAIAHQVSQRLKQPDLDLTSIKHSGFKDFTEGPPVDTPILLRQDAYKALTEPVIFREADGSETQQVHTARFGEIEQRFYATTPKGRSLYDECLQSAEAERAKNPTITKTDPDGYLARYAEAFKPFPKTVPELVRTGMIFARYSVTAKGASNAQPITTTDIFQLVDQGLVEFEGLRYEDFLPFSAAGIFASNLGQYGTKASGDQPTICTKEGLEKIMGRPITDPNRVYAGLEAESLLQVYSELGVLDELPAERRHELETIVEAYRATANAAHTPA
jgi:uncharacterized glyoxalase superfamily metalloenzyme YdcJ